MGDRSFNLFDLSRESRPKKKSPPPAPINKNTYTSEESFKLINEMKDRHTEIVQQMEDAYRKTGIEPDELTRYCENPNNFTTTQWEHHKRAKDEIERAITGMSSEEIRQAKEAKAKGRVTKERRGKTLGSRKNWLNMH